MRARLSLRVIVGGLFLFAGSLAPAAADCLLCEPAETTDEGLLVRARGQMGELNRYVHNPPPCEVEAPSADGQGTTVYTGYLQWRLTAVDQGTWDDIYGSESGTFYRLECFVPEIHTEFGELLEVREFPDVNPINIAHVAIDDALARIPTQQIATSPAGASLVGFETWFWVEGVPSGGVSATASVPGMSVTATAQPGGVHYEFGDNTSRDCIGQGVAWSPGAVSDCTHVYGRAGHYTVTSTILWSGTFTVNGAGPFPIVRALPRTDSFVLPVQEAQAINTLR